MASTATANNSLNRRDPFSISASHANGHASDPDSHHSTPSSPARTRTDSAGLSIRAFVLGLTFGTSLVTTILIAFHGHPLWRLPFFFAVLSLFHWLEFQVTAIYNPTVATISAFLLSQNGSAYNIAHTLASLECLMRYTDIKVLNISLEGILSAYAPERIRTLGTTFASFHNLWLALGFTLLVSGQVIRTIAMARAGSNFNHTVQMRKKQGHVLVTDGIYAWLRHPSYFGFFWWGLGTQVVLNNTICLAGYIVVLWRFFDHRIRGKFCLSIF